MRLTNKIPRCPLNLQWIPWSYRSQNIPFKSEFRGIGDGEYKVAAELNTQILGQNSHYDIKMMAGGFEYECDVKKLDKEINANFSVEAMLVSDEEGKDLKVGTPTVAGSKVELKVVEQFKGEKVRVFKMKSKKRYARNK